MKPIRKISKAKIDWGVVQVVVLLPGKCKARVQTPETPKKKNPKQN
jgi:hypothetical protein